jgi:hypothetical protein
VIKLKRTDTTLDLSQSATQEFCVNKVGGGEVGDGGNLPKSAEEEKLFEERGDVEYKYPLASAKLWPLSHRW